MYRMKKFRTLRADEIDCRISTVKGNGLTLLLYKDARCDMNILDEAVGAENWQRSHSRDNANCTVSIWDEYKKQWVSKEDTGTESFTEKEKGLASDSFKRACFNWGIGRELYTAPRIWISSSDCDIKKKDRGDGYTCFDRFYVSEIDYDSNNCINKLQIKHCKSHKVVFDLGKTKNIDTSSRGSELASEAQKKAIRALCIKHKIDVDMLYASNCISETEMTDKQAANILQSFKKKYGDD